MGGRGRRKEKKEKKNHTKVWEEENNGMGRV